MDESGAESTEELHFFYDAQSRPAFVEYNGVKYRYVHNLQGDIVGIVDAAGNLVVEYRYDAWGKLLSITGTLKTSLGRLNPFRYRGYVHDEESALYYLRSRYYNLVIGRFVNADVIQASYSSMLQYNLYCYCLNNPAIYADSEGRFALLAIGFGMLIEAFVSAVVYTAAVVLTAVVATEVVDLVTDISNTRAREKELTEAQTTTVAKTETATNTNQKKKQAGEHLHHIVAKADWRAAPARQVLDEYGIDVWNNPHNLVLVPADKHARLHTNVYFLHVNSRMIIARRRGGYAGVIKELKMLRLEILAGTILK